MRSRRGRWTSILHFIYFVSVRVLRFDRLWNGYYGLIYDDDGGGGGGLSILH